MIVVPGSLSIFSADSVSPVVGTDASFRSGATWWFVRLSQGILAGRSSGFVSARWVSPGKICTRGDHQTKSTGRRDPTEVALPERRLEPRCCQPDLAIDRHGSRAKGPCHNQQTRNKSLGPAYRRLGWLAIILRTTRQTAKRVDSFCGTESLRDDRAAFADLFLRVGGSPVNM